MIQSIYTSVNNANLVSCGKKGQHITSEPIPLLRDKYLSEYRTELEKAKVRRNLGIKDDQKIAWGQLGGFIEEQKDLINYVEQKWEYKSDLDESITTVEQALNYVIHYVKTFKSEAEDVQKLFTQTEELRTNLQTLRTDLSADISKNAQDINKLQINIEGINQAISQLNEKLLTINVDKNILEWMKHAVEGSNSMHLTEDNKLDVTISNDPTNAIKVLEGSPAETEPNPEEGGEPIIKVPEITPGIYVKDVSENVTTLETTVATHDTSINQMTAELEVVDTYQTTLSDDTVSPDKIGGIEQGTSVAKLKGKTITEILDFILFPTFVRDLIYPQVQYSIYDTLLEINSPVLVPELTFIQNDAGPENSRTEVINLLGSPQEITTYNQLGIYTHVGTVSYDAGEYLIDNKGEVTEKRIEAGSLSAQFSVTTTYPWYVVNNKIPEKQELVRFGQEIEVTFNLTGESPSIKLPGKNTTMLAPIKVDAGMGFLDVDMAGWEETTELIQGYTYKVWKKKDSYLDVLPHKIKFKLVD